MLPGYGKGEYGYGIRDSGYGMGDTGHGIRDTASQLADSFGEREKIKLLAICTVQCALAKRILAQIFIT